MKTIPSARVRFTRRYCVLAALCTAFVAFNPQPGDTGTNGANAATGPTLTVTPSTGLVTQAVTVNWTGFAAATQFGSDAVWIYQCKANPQSLADCYTADPFPSSAGGNTVRNGVTGLDLSGSANFEVRDASELSDLSCSSTTPCSIVAFDSNTTIPANGLPPGAVVAPITFAQSSATCPIPINFDATIGGEASVAQQTYQWDASQCTGAKALSIDFTESSSNNARSNMLAGLTDLAFTSLGATPAELATATNPASIQYAPISLNAAVFAFNISDAVTGQQITDMTLSPRLVTRLVTDSQLLGFFQDPEFLALNPTHNWPTGGASQPMLRAEANADTHITTEWMYHDPNSKLLLAGTDIHGVRVMPDFKNKVYPVENFEIAASDSSGFVPHTGEIDAARRLFYQARPDGTQSSNQGYIGLLSRSNAVRFGLPMASLVNGAGKAVAPDQAGLLAGVQALHLVDGALVPDVTSTAPAAYPLTKIDYAMVRTSVFTVDANQVQVGDPVKAAHLQQLLNYAIGAGQQDLALGYLPLPAAQIATAASVIKTIAAPGTPTTTSTTTPTTTSTAPKTTTTSTSLTPTSVTDFGTPTTIYNASGLGSACCGGSGGSSATFTTDGAGLVSSPTDAPTSKQATQPAPLRFALTAPSWTPIASIGPISSHIALPLLLLLGAIAAIISGSWPAIQRLLRWRRQQLKKVALA